MILTALSENSSYGSWHKMRKMRKQPQKFILTACSDAPMYLFSSSGPFMDINLSEEAAAAAPTI